MSSNGIRGEGGGSAGETTGVGDLGQARGTPEIIYFRGAKRQRELRSRLQAIRYAPGDEYPSREVQEELRYLADRLFVSRSLIPGADLGLRAREDIGSNELISVYCGPVRAEAVGDYMLTVWDDGPMVDGTPRDLHPLSMAGRANDPLWKARLVNARFDEAGLLISTRRIRKGEEILVDYETGYDWDRLKLAYIPTLVATIDAAAAHYTEKCSLQQEL